MARSKVGNLYITLGLDLSGFAKDMMKVANDMRKLGDGITRFGETIDAKISGPLREIGKSILGVSGDFQSAMLKLGAVTQASSDDMQRMSDVAKKMGADTVFSSSQAAEGMNELAKAGFNVDQIISAIPGVMNVAAAEQIGLGQASSIVGSILNGFGMAAERAGGVANELAQASINSNAGITDLGEAFRVVGPVAKSVGMSFEETAATLGVMADAGIKGSSAGTALSSAIAALIKPVGEGKDKIRELGINVFEADGKMRPFKDIIDEIGKKANGTKDIFAIFGRETGPEMAALINQGRDSIVDLQGKLNPLEDTAKRLGDSQMAGLNGALQAFWGSVETLGIAIGESGLLDWMTSLVKVGTDIVNWLAGINPAFLGLISIVGGIAGAVGPAAIAIGTLANAFGEGAALMVGLSKLKTAVLALFSIPAGLIVAAIVAAVGLIIYYWDELASAGKWLAEKLGIDLEAVAAGWRKFTHDLEEWWNKSEAVAAASAKLIADSEKKLWEAINKARAGGTEAIQKFAGAVADNGRKVGGITLGIGTAFSGARSKVEGELKKTAGAAETHFPRMGGAASKSADAAKRAGERFADTVDKMQTDMAEAMSKLVITVDDAAWPMEVAANGMARSLVDSFGVNLEDLSDKTKDELGLVERELSSRQNAWQELGEALADSVFAGVLEGGNNNGLHSLDEAAAMAGEATMDAFREGAGRKLEGVRGVFTVLVDGIKENFGSLKDNVATLSRDIATNIVTGEGSIVDSFEKMAEKLKIAVLDTIINTILTELLKKIEELIRLMIGSRSGPTGGDLGSGLLKPKNPGDGGDNGGIGGGIPGVKSKNLLGATEQITTGGANRTVSMAFTLLSQELSRMILNFGDYGKASASKLLDELFGPNGTLRNVPGFSEVNFPDIWDVLKWFMGNWGDWLPGNGGGWGPGGGLPGGGWKPTIPGGFGGGGPSVVVHVHGSVTTERDLAESVRRAIINRGTRLDYSAGFS